MSQIELLEKRVVLPMEAKTLYFGFDESNHAGQNRKGEIVVAVVSTLHEDSLIRYYSHHKTNVDFLNLGGVYDYRFTLLMGEEYRHATSFKTLAEIAPFLVEPFLHDELKCLKLYFDGIMKKPQKNFLRARFPQIESIVVQDFVKKGKLSKASIKKKRDIACPRVVYLADSLAHALYLTPTGNLLSHPKFIPPPLK